MNNTSLGKASLWTSIVGIVLPVCLIVVASLCGLYTPSRMGTGPPTSTTKAAGLLVLLSFFLFVLLELIAFGCGVAASRTAMGKAGLVISGVLLPLVIGLITFVLHRVQWSW